MHTNNARIAEIDTLYRVTVLAQADEHGVFDATSDDNLGFITIQAPPGSSEDTLQSLALEALGIYDDAGYTSTPDEEGGFLVYNPEGEGFCFVELEEVAASRGLMEEEIAAQVAAEYGEAA